MALPNSETRLQLTEEIINRRDGVVRRIAQTMNLTVVSGRKPIAQAGWDASYKLQATDGRIIEIVDRALSPGGIANDEELEADVLKQISDALAKT